MSIRTHGARRARLSRAVPFALAALALGACEESTSAPEPAPATTSAALHATLNTFIANCLEIDELGGGPPDANLYTGNDPADGSVSAQLPTCNVGSFIDWQNLCSDLANHKVSDAFSGQDPSSFPRANECVGSSNVLSKMDLTYVGVASNNEYVYTVAQRSANNGDAGYFWLWNQLEPQLLTGAGPCRPSEKQLVYDISENDVMMVGHFAPSGGPLLTVYKAAFDAADLTAVQATDFNLMIGGQKLWVEDTDAVAAAAVNTTVTAPGCFGSTGVKSMSGQNLGKELIAEAAISLDTFGLDSACGATFYGTIITRPSGSGGTSPDFKDLVGPEAFNFGSASATASVAADCSQQLAFSLDSFTDGMGNPIANPSCSWTCEADGETDLTSLECSGTFTDAAPVEWTCSVVVTDGTSGCSSSVSAGSATPRAPIAVEIELVAAPSACPASDVDFGGTQSIDSVTYQVKDGFPTGGDGDYSYTWVGATGCTGTSCTINPADGDMCHVQTISLTVDDGDPACDSANSGDKTYRKVTTITADP